MFAYIIWGIIILAIILSFRRLASGLVLTIVLIAAIFFVVFIIDRASDVPIRDYIPMEWFDETLDEPERKAKEVGEGFTEAGKDVADTVDEKGKELDIKYGTGDSKEWVEVEEEESKNESKEDENAKEDNDKEEVSKEEKDKTEQKEENKQGKKENKQDKKEKKEDKNTKKLKSDEGLYVEYDDVEDVINKYLDDINEEDKDIMKTMSGIYKTKFEGEDIVVWNNKGTGNEGLYVKFK